MIKWQRSCSALEVAGHGAALADGVVEFLSVDVDKVGNIHCGNVVGLD